MTGHGGPGATDRTRRRRQLRFAGFTVVLGAATALLFLRGRGGTVATFVLNDARGERFLLPPLRVPVVPTVAVLAVAIIAVGVLQLVRDLGRRAPITVGAAGALFVVALLVWAGAGASVSLVALFRGALFASVPIAFGAMAGVLCERAGVINIAIEGQFLAGAFTAAIVASVLGSAWFGLLGGIAAGALIGLMLAGLTIRYRADQIVSGVVLIVLATGVTSFLTSQVLASRTALNSPVRFTPSALPLLSDIPLVGSIVFRQTLLVYLMLVMVGVLQFALFRTRWGLRLRSVGEHPAAADTVGIDVLRTRFRAVVLGGMLAGIGGSWFTLEAASQFSKEMTGGRGFIALAAMLVGRYSPVGALSAALLFGFADSLATTLQRLPVPLPSTLLRATPYVITLLVVAGLVGRLRVPAADGKAYIKQ
jgi:general nucleoside transport system permease protein